MIYIKIVILSVTTPLLLKAQGLIIDHTAVEKFKQIPAEWIEKAKNNLKVHFQHTSHGAQITKGLEIVETALYDVACDEESLPNILFPSNSTPAIPEVLEIAVFVSTTYQSSYFLQKRYGHP